MRLISFIANNRTSVGVLTTTVVLDSWTSGSKYPHGRSLMRSQLGFAVNLPPCLRS